MANVNPVTPATEAKQVNGIAGQTGKNDPNPVPKDAFNIENAKVVYDTPPGLVFPIGMPPVELYFSNKVFEATIPVMFIVPGEGHFAQGLDLFTFSSLMDSAGGFREKMKTDFEVSIPTRYSAIPIAFTPDSIPGIQLSNEYGASFLQNLTEVAAPTLGQLGQIMGGTNAGVGELFKQMAGAGAEIAGGGKTANRIATGIGGAVDYANDILKRAGEGVAGTRGGEVVQKAANIVSQMLMGARVDFPKVWLGSSFSGPVSINVRLYNPNQASEASYFTRIINPLKILLSLAAPISTTDNVYRWPYIHQIYCQGLFFWRMAAIIGMNVQPGAENQMSWNQRPSMVDVRIDFQPLHQVMLNRRTSNVPNVGDWVKQLTTKREAPNLWEAEAGAPTQKNADLALPQGSRKDTVSKPTPTSNPEESYDPDPRQDPATVKKYNDLKAAGQYPAGVTEDLALAASAEKQFKEDSLRQAKEQADAEVAARQYEEVQSLRDREMQENLDYYQSEPQPAGPSYQDGPDLSQSLNQTTVGNVTDSVTPGTQEEWNQAEATTAQAREAGKSTSIFQSLSSKLSAAGDKIVTDAKSTVSTIVDSASDRARRINEAVKKATGTEKKTGDDIKTTALQTATPINEERKATVIPTTNESTVKAQTEPTVVASQQNMQAMTSEIVNENQSYIQSLQVWNNLLEKTTDPATKTYAQTRINLLNTNHEFNLTTIENKYKP